MPKRFPQPLLPLVSVLCANSRQGWVLDQSPMCWLWQGSEVMRIQEGTEALGEGVARLDHTRICGGHGTWGSLPAW